MQVASPRSKHIPDLGALGRFIRERRRELGLTQQGLARRIGYVQERVSLLENGKYGLPSLPALVDLADALEVPLSSLLASLGYAEQLAAPDTAPATTSIPVTEPLSQASQVRALAETSRALTAGMEHLQIRLGTAEERMHTVERLHAEMVERRTRMQSLLTALQWHPEPLPATGEDTAGTSHKPAEPPPAASPVLRTDGSLRGQ